MIDTVKKIVLVSFVTLSGVCCLVFTRGQNAAAESPAPGSPAEIFAANCAVCHGRDGRAKTARGKRAGATDFTSDWNRDESRGVRIITNGKGQMPSFKKKLTAAEIRSVFSYVARF